jgi:predicted DNA-binding transcriptional regulator YafY
MVSARLTDGKFEPRDDISEVLETADVFQDADSAEDVRVRFTPGIARWVKERYPDYETAKGGAVDVVFRAGNPQWLARHVLQYGAEAEVIEPKAYREAVRKVVVGRREPQETKGREETPRPWRGND